MWTNREEVLSEKCEKEINDIYATINKNQEECDKQLLALSVGFLAITLAFIKNIVPIGRAHHIWELLLSVIFLIACIVCVLASFQVSNFGLFKAKEYWEKKEVEENADFSNRWAEWIKKMNVISCVLFVFGIIMAVIFVPSNLRK